MEIPAIISDNIFPVINATIKGERWEYYDKSVELAKKYTRYNSGCGMDEELRLFVPRESDVMFQQRKLLTKQVVSSVCSTIRQPFNKVPRTPGIKKVIRYEGENTQGKPSEKLEKLNKTLNNFYGNKSLSYYLDQRLIDLSFIDPNAYIIIEWQSFDNTQELAQPYPFEVESEYVLNKSVFNEIVEWLVIQNEESFTFYGKNQSVRYTLVTDERIISLFGTDDKSKEESEGTYIEVDGKLYTKQNRKVYLIFIPTPHNLGYVPAFISGYRYDIEEFGELFQSPLVDGMPYLEKMVKLTSENDLTMTLHVFPQKFQYVAPCAARGCNGGSLPDGAKCPACKGTGRTIHTSSQDLLEIPLPDDVTQMLKLSDLVYYAYPPTEIVKIQVERLNEYADKAVQAVFNSETLIKKTFSETATSDTIDLQSLYDTLFYYAQKYAATWEFAVKCCADITGLGTDLICKCIVNKDFKMKTQDEMIAELTNAYEKGLPSGIRAQMLNDVVDSIYADQPYDRQKFKVQQIFEPFNWRTQEEVIYFLSILPNEHPKKILRMFFNDIFEEIEQEDTDGIFYFMPYLKQKEIVDKKVVEYIEGIKVQPLQLPAFNQE